jgi:hypothetical protein
MRRSRFKRASVVGVAVIALAIVGGMAGPVVWAKPLGRGHAGSFGFSNAQVLVAQVDAASSSPSTGASLAVTPASLPATVTNADLKVSLLKFVSGLEAGDGGSGGKTTNGVTTATFRVEQSGDQTTEWAPEGLKVTDATGKAGSKVFWVGGSGASGEFVVRENYGGGLETNQVWRLKLRMRRRNRLTGGQVWTSPAIVVGRSAATPSSEETAAGVPITNVVERFPGLDTNIHLEASEKPLFVIVAASIDRLPPGAELSLAGVFDDKGAELRGHCFDYQKDDRFEFFEMKTEGLRSIRVSVALSGTREVEFLARPTRE